MTGELAVEGQTPSGLRRLDPRRVPRHLLVAGAVVVVMLAVWAALAVIYSGIGGGRSVADVRSVMETVTSTRATSGAVTVQSILATPEYFAVADRGDGFFGLAPEQNLVTLTRNPGGIRRTRPERQRPGHRPREDVAAVADGRRPRGHDPRPLDMAI